MMLRDFFISYLLMLHDNAHTAGEAEEEGYEDEYQLEELEVAAADYIRPTYTPNFRAVWEQLPEDSEMVRGWGLMVGGVDHLLLRWGGGEGVGRRLPEV